MHIRENLDLLRTSFLTFSAGNRIWLLYAISVAYLLIRGGKTARRVFVWPLLFLGLTVFNPLLTGFLISRFGFEERFLRFFWVICAYAATSFAILLFLGRLKKRSAAAALGAGAALIAAVIILGNPVFLGKGAPKYELTGNTGFVDEDYVRLKALLHEDENAGETEENTDGRNTAGSSLVVLYGSTLMMNYRMYDPDVVSLMNRTMLNQFMSYSGVEEYLEKCRMKPNLKRIFQVFFFDDFSVPVRHFCYSCRKRNVDYVVCSSISKVNDYLEGSEYFEKKGTTENYVVWKVL